MKSIAKLPILIWTVLTLMAYASVWVSPVTFKYSGLMSFGIPFFLLLNIALVLILVFKKPKKALLPFILVLIGFPFIKSTLVFHKTSVDQSNFSVMNYNVMLMRKKGTEVRPEMVKWMANETADIKCFQEFFYTPEIAKEIAKKGEYNVFAGAYKNALSIFSKYPIINKGAFYESKSTNNILFVDLKINRDTIRVYNVHLESMAINVDQMMDQEKIEENYDIVRHKIENGSVSRAKQINDLIKHIEESPYPVIVAGDFNDIPYSYNYFKLSRYFDNAFEKAGSGFGFTYNGKIPFLRIDNQFFRGKIKVHKFSTLKHIDYSDHFPVVGYYSVSD